MHDLIGQSDFQAYILSGHKLRQRWQEQLTNKIIFVNIFFNFQYNFALLVDLNRSYYITTMIT